MPWGQFGLPQNTKIYDFIRRYLRNLYIIPITMNKITKTEWDNTPKSVKELVEKLVGTLEVVVPK